jgi:hypothetical protein
MRPTEWTLLTIKNEFIYLVSVIQHQTLVGKSHQFLQYKVHRLLLLAACEPLYQSKTTMGGQVPLKSIYTWQDATHDLDWSSVNMPNDTRMNDNEDMNAYGQRARAIRSTNIALLIIVRQYL